MSSLLDSAPGVKGINLGFALRQLSERERELRAQATVDEAAIRAEAQQIADAERFKWKDLLNPRRLFRHRESFDEAFARLRSERLDRARQFQRELATMSGIVDPFRAMCRKLDSMTPASELASEGSRAKERDERTALLDDIHALREGIRSAGACRAISSFPFEQLATLERQLRADLDSMKGPPREEDLPSERPPSGVAHPMPVGHGEAPSSTVTADRDEPSSSTIGAGREEIQPVVTAPLPPIDRKGPLMHLGAPIELGAEKEENMRTVGPGDKLDHTAVSHFERGLLPEITEDMRKPSAAEKPADQIQWSDLNDKGKCAYMLAFRAKYGTEDKARWPSLRVTNTIDYSDLSFEPNGWIEVISSKFGSVRELEEFLNKFGWGHIHTSFMRGASTETQLRQVAWMRNANLYMFLNALETRGASGNGESFWRFAIKGLSLPTEDHLRLAQEMIKYKKMTATAFSKHLHIGMRASGKYGHPNRIGFETRGGSVDEKKRVLDSLLRGLVTDRWGAEDDIYGQGAFRMVSVGNTQIQVHSLPVEFRDLIRQHLLEHPIEGLSGADADRLFEFVRSARFYDRPKAPAARLNEFDQRACTPLLQLERIRWLTDEERERVVNARAQFISSLAELEARKDTLKSTEVAQKTVDLIVAWAKAARLAGPFGRWIDGAAREQFFS